MKKRCKFTIVLESSQVMENSVVREEEYLLDDDAISVVEDIVACIATTQYAVNALQNGKNAPKLKFRLNRI